jgi:hypothetical protein
MNKNVYERVLLNAGRDNSKVHLNEFVYANTSARIILATPTGYTPQMASFTANKPAYCTIGGKIFFQEEQSAQNVVLQSGTLNHATWSKFDANDNIALSAQTDPVGTFTGWKLKPSATNGYHYIYRAATHLSAAIYARNNGYNYFYWRAIFGTDTTIIIYNLTTGEVTINAHPEYVALTSCKPGTNGYRECFALYTAPTAYIELGITNSSSAPAFAGNGTDGIDLWLPQGYASKYYSTSPIITTTFAATRNADVFYIPVALRSRINISFSLWAVPRFSDTQRVLAANSAYLIDQYIDATHGVQLYIDSSSNLVLDINGANSFTQALTYSADSMPKFTVNPVTGAVTVAGALTGDGTYGSTPFTFAAGADIYWGGKNGGTLQADSLISLPY